MLCQRAMATEFLQAQIAAVSGLLRNCSAMPKTGATLSAGAAAIVVHFRLYRAQGLRYLLFSAVLSTIAGLALKRRHLAHSDNYRVLYPRGGHEAHVSTGPFSIPAELSRMDQGKRHYRSYARNLDVCGPPRNCALGSGAVVGRKHDPGRRCADRGCSAGATKADPICARSNRREIRGIAYRTFSWGARFPSKIYCSS
jgi:hypothetical protein